MSGLFGMVEPSPEEQGRRERMAAMARECESLREQIAANEKELAAIRIELLAREILPHSLE
jgi:hypothetical protein